MHHQQGMLQKGHMSCPNTIFLIHYVTNLYK